MSNYSVGDWGPTLDLYFSAAQYSNDISALSSIMFVAVRFSTIGESRKRSFGLTHIRKRVKMSKPIMNNIQVQMFDQKQILGNFYID